MHPPVYNSVMAPHLVIVGGGFAGLYAARTAARLSLRITVLDRRNHHLFQPLLYQVASAVLSPADIAAPIRTVLRRQRNVEVLLEEVTGFDLEHQLVRLNCRDLSYDYLIVAAGVSHSYFGHDDWSAHAPGLKTIEDALEMRRRILLAYELAERDAAEDPNKEPRDLTFVVIGGGPTGVELAGALADIARYALASDFRYIDPLRTRVMLLEGGSRVLPTYSEDLSFSAAQQLRRLGVEVRTGAVVTGVEPGRVHVRNVSPAIAPGGDANTCLPADVILWAAGVSASPLGKMLGAPTDRAGRVLVKPDLSVPGHPEVFVCGDLAALEEDGNWLPGVAPVAMQQGCHAARNIAASLAAKPSAPFRYHDKGSLATIGRAAAVAQFKKLHFSGLTAWLLWLFVHIFYLIGFRNRAIVMMEWAWAYFTRQRGIRLITKADSQ